MSPDQIKQFVTKYYPLAKQLEQKYGMPAWASLAQWAHETNYGTSNIFLQKNNIAGIGAVDKNPNDAMSFPSPEDSADYAVRVQTDHAQLPQNQPFTHQKYGPTAPIITDPKSSPQQVFAAIQDSKWASDPNYANNLMTRYNQIQPYLNNSQPVTKQTMIQPPPANGVPGTPDYGSTRANPVAPLPNQNIALQNTQNQMNQQQSRLPVNQPGYSRPVPPPSQFDFGQAGQMIGNAASGLGSFVSGLGGIFGGK